MSTRAVIYTRQSLDRTGEGLAVARQRQDAEKLCAERGWTVREVISDNDVSASSGKPRPGFLRVLNLVEGRQVDVVVAWHVDRLVRKLADLETVIERCERSGVRLATVSGDLDLSTDAGRLVGRILASVARGEIERKGARQRRAHLQAAEAGQPVRWSHRPFGYRLDKVTPEPAEAAAVRQACEQVLSGGTLRSIARQWNAAGLVPPQGGKAWTNTTVRAVLTRPGIAGLSTHHGEIVGRGGWEPLVSEETWMAVREVLADPSRRPARGTQTLLGGLARCHCGAPVYGGRSQHRGRIYRCRDLPGGGGGHVARVAAPVDEYVTELVIARLSRPDARDLLVDDTRPDVGGLRAQAAALRARLDQVAVEFAEDDTVSPAQLRSITERLRVRLGEVEARLADAGRLDVLGPVVGADDVRAAWASLDLDRARAVIDVLMTVTLHRPGMGRRTFHPATIEIRWKDGSTAQ